MMLTGREGDKMTTKNFVCSDIHDDLEALAAFADFAKSQEADRLLLLGDLSLRPYTAEALSIAVQTNDVPAFIRAKETHNGKTLSGMKAVLDRSGIQYHVIPGNYDGSLVKIFGERDLHARTAQFGGAKVMGYGGADAFPPHIALLVRLGEITPFDHQELFDLLKKETPAIGLIHNPPRNLCDDMYNGENVGTPATLRYIIENHPKLVLSGHIHEAGPNGNNPNGARGIRAVEIDGKKTLVVNPGNLGRFEIIDEITLATEKQFPYGTFSEVHLEDDGTPTKVAHYSVEERPSRTIGKVRKLAEYSI